MALSKMTTPSATFPLVFNPDKGNVPVSRPEVMPTPAKETAPVSRPAVMSRKPLDVKKQRALANATRFAGSALLGKTR